MRVFLLIGLIAGALAVPVRAQELNCNVNLNRARLTGNEFEFLDELRSQIRRYLNDTVWTEDLFESREQIDCAVQIAILANQGLSSFTAELTVEASRPIYGTGQRTRTVLIRDQDWNFTYTRGQSLIRDPNTFDALTSVLDFYALLILGYDYDSFSELGGTPFFEEARQTADLGRARGAEGWTSEAGEDRSRYTLIQELMDPAFLALRRAVYTYHYDVLDHFVIDPQAAWAKAIETLTALDGLYQQFNRRRYATDVFFAAKHEELTDLMMDAPQRNDAYALLSQIDAVHLGTYDALVSGR